MTLKSKFVFKEKTLISEILEDTYFQVIEDKEYLYFLLMSELSLKDADKIECNISRKDGVVSFNNIGDNIENLTDVSLYTLLDETPEPAGSVISYSVDVEEINDLTRLIKTAKKIKVISFVAENIDEVEALMEKQSYEMADGDDYMEELVGKVKGYGISNKTKDSLSKVVYDMCSANGWITPFYFIENLDKIEKVKLPDHIKQIKIFEI